MSSNGTNGTTTAGWHSLPKAMAPALEGLSKSLNGDPWWQSFIKTDAIVEPVSIGVQSIESDDTVLVKVESGAKTSVSTGPSDRADFVLAAKGEQWQKFFDKDPKAPYTSFVGLQGMNIVQEGVGVNGNNTKFAQYSHLATRLLELLRDGLHGPMEEDTQSESDEDSITGRYVYINPPVWGRSKTFVESAGNGPQEIVFCHTAGSDSRQYHGVMNDKRMQEKCTMYAFDLPAHGRSFPYKNYVPGGHTNTEDAYCGAIREIIRVLKLNKPIVCGASMAGQVCVAVAIRADEIGAGGTIPLQGCDYLTMERQFQDKSPVVNQALFNPDWIYGMMAPKSPAVNKLLVWHTYSSQAYGIFHGDLDFYFGGFDARSRVSSIDTSKCPIHFLTGEYDWSTTPQMAADTAAKIKGAKAVAMKDLGHFPATENPKIFVPYLLDAIDWIQQKKKKQKNRAG